LEIARCTVARFSLLSHPPRAMRPFPFDAYHEANPKRNNSRYHGSNVDDRRTNELNEIAHREYR
tara:strand:- start:10 stop:201 length:192 start_codon:yes stop_codon:yes gene_type:complete